MRKGENDGTTSRAGDDLDPDIGRFVREMAAAWAAHPELASASPVEARRIAERVRSPWAQGGPRMAAITELAVPVGRHEVRVRRYQPEAEGPLGALIYLHGGGWTLFSLDTHDRVMRELAARAGVVVLGIDYALSPEAKFPVALEQVCAVVRFASGRGAEALGVDRARLAIGGDSAGGNLAVGACLVLRESGEEGRLRALLLNYPVLERQSSDAAILSYGGAGNMLTAEEMEQFWRNYLDDERDADDPLVSPLRGDLRGLPPVLLVVPECDLLAEQSFEMADRLRSAQMPVELRLYQGATHSFLEAIAIAPLADRALDDAARWLRATLFGAAV
jgi:acetyl esterase